LNELLGCITASISVSVVIYAPKWEVLQDTLVSLRKAASTHGRLHTLYLVDNGPLNNEGELLREAQNAGFVNEQIKILSGHGNIGYGRAHNLAIRASKAHYHLVLNPDVLIDIGALATGASYLNNNPQVCMVAPYCEPSRPEEPTHLCKSYPSILVLALRALGSKRMNALFASKLRSYELRDLIKDGGAKVVPDIPIASGAYMFCRTTALEAINGFDERYFLYFEDFDLSIRLRKHGRIDFVPTICITHAGGQASRKGVLHIRHFCRSAYRFFSEHGWRIQ
jgi:GT2 family glycosyltransferase